MSETRLSPREDLIEHVKRVIATQDAIKSVLRSLNLVFNQNETTLLGSGMRHDLTNLWNCFEYIEAMEKSLKNYEMDMAWKLKKHSDIDVIKWDNAFNGQTKTCDGCGSRDFKLQKKYGHYTCRVCGSESILGNIIQKIKTQEGGNADA